ncbi:MAG: hypothetical protein KKD39_04720, partial [Candidatus Altiarchaeota archaeon]|nr:hypothetical protein [Candidatus Altiarchaeota archaeon]
ICESNISYDNMLSEKISFTGPLIASDNKLTKGYFRGCDVLFIISTGLSQLMADKILSVARDTPETRFAVMGSYVCGKKSGNVEDLGIVEDATYYISKSRMIITTGGHTTVCEALCLGKPVLCIPIENHIEQQNIAMLVERKGFGLVLSPHVEVNNIKDKIKTLLDEKKYEKNCIKLKKIYFHTSNKALKTLIDSIKLDAEKKRREKS